MKAAVIIFCLISMALTFSCGKSEQPDGKKKDINQGTKSVNIREELLFGKWINKESNSGFEIALGGKATSINQPKYEYETWRIEGSNLVLNFTTKSSDSYINGDEIYIIRELTADKLLVSPFGDPSSWKAFEKQK